MSSRMNHERLNRQRKPSVDRRAPAAPKDDLARRAAAEMRRWGRRIGLSQREMRLMFGGALDR